MNKEEFKKAMSNPKNVYCLVSSDAEIIDLYLNRFKTAIQADQLNYGSIQATGKLFKKKTLNVIYATKLSEDMFEKKEFVFIHTDSVDKRTSVYKKYKNQLIEISNDYTNWVMEHSNMTLEEAKAFCKKCLNDLGIIRSELLIYDSCGYNYNNYSSDGIAWVDSFLKKEPLPQYNESEISLMSLLSVNCSNLLNVKRHNTAGMNPYIVKCMLPVVKYRKEEELMDIIQDCFYYDCQIKKGLIEPKYTIALLKEEYYGPTTH